MSIIWIHNLSNAMLSFFITIQPSVDWQKKKCKNLSEDFFHLARKQYVSSKKTSFSVKK
jgi:hypothetical protein